ncbi:SWIM zinc finger family protein [Dyadobacter frigoris]|uniref:SWIM-type domain-containing protein n=1 Tax=Dyadobacter frigoris TaxID=2576211 RepID=A0A4U6D882_9BACT|nr:SWIM zinc finger family protein [Dyadobacter frigoris]TKT93662.1 hypothetical protein FDK13_00160 [Dyadobacter frigoris]GLU51128.1 hypothetical protein Dfri01_05890 [Dyadobacter frigoris]
MNLRNFHQQISPIILQRGKDYYNEGAVINLEEEENGLWNADVEGSEVYTVEVQLGESGEIDTFFCDCPHDADVCKHIVAVFYELKDAVKIIKLEPQKKKDHALSFSELMKKVGVSELKEFVELFAKSDKNFKNQFELHFAYKDEKIDVEKKYTDLIKKVIRSTMSQGYVNYYSAGDLSGKIDNFLDKAQEAIENQNFKDAVMISRVALKQLVEDVIPNADDSNGDIGDTISNAISILRIVAESEFCAQELKENMHDFLASELANDNYFDYGDFGDECFEIFRYLSVQLKRPDAFLAFMELWADNYRAEYFIKQTILFFKETGNTIEAEKLIRQHMDIVEVRQGVVDEAIERKEYAEAKELIYQGIVLAQKRQHPGTISEWQKTLLRIAGLEGDLVMQRHFNLLFAFDRGFNPEYYKNWKDTFQQTEWEVKFDGLIQKIVDEVEREAERHLNNHWWSKNNALLNRLAPIYLQEKQFDKLYQLVEGYPSLEVLLNYMKYLAKDYQPELIDLLYPALLIAGDRADSRSGYARIASYMIAVIKLMPASRGRILDAVQVLRTKYPRRPAMLDELKAIK